MPEPRPGSGLSRAAAFNARAEWNKADALYAEYTAMLELDSDAYTDAWWQSGDDALESARLACDRALAEARKLAPWWDVAGYDTGADAA